MTKLDFDEIHELVSTSVESGQDVEGIIEDIASMMLLAYKRGKDEIDEEFDYYAAMVVPNIYSEKFAGETFVDRVYKHIEMATDEPITDEPTGTSIHTTSFKNSAGEVRVDLPALTTLAETECQRLYNRARDEEARSYAKSTGTKLTKTWATMMDDKVRDQHQYLEGMTVGLNEEFFTYDGDSAMFPNGFSNPENNCNCRCWVTYKRA